MDTSSKNLQFLAVDDSNFHAHILLVGKLQRVKCMAYLRSKDVKQQSFHESCSTLQSDDSKQSLRSSSSSGDHFLKERVVVPLVDTVFLIKKSLQKGILQLQDKANNAHRATKRIEILHGLLHEKYKVSEAFIRILTRRIISLLSVQEKKENWVIAQALSGHFVAEGGSFRHMLWVHLEDTVASALAQILAVIDGDNNLDNLISDQSPEMNNLDNLISDQAPEMAQLWLRIFQGDQWDLLNIPVIQSVFKWLGYTVTLQMCLI
ncbi:E3 ubiquitin-protein ligase rnf213-alpha-like [Clupea harengus]|uniref:E3 ubiquitin-protein ligase rnf213-alpha-like n=1 Tax=Clupea harengus TaxID=7950 RepID=A0A6P8FZ89_CLUHA|nr:E3 ubiquitin-protein ligase rnf213-alpha-like [Clupea harengus]